MNVARRAALIVACTIGAAPAMADTTLIPSPNGAIALTSPKDRTAYDTYKYAPARRAGDLVYVSGVVIRRLPDGPRTAETFRAAARLGFEAIAARLHALGADVADVVMMNSYHDWTAPEFGGDRMAQFQAFNDVKEEFMASAHPAWTAVGTSGLISESGIVEVQVIAFASRPVPDAAP